MGSLIPQHLLHLLRIRCQEQIERERDGLLSFYAPGNQINMRLTILNQTMSSWLTQHICIAFLALPVSFLPTYMYVYLVCWQPSCRHFGVPSYPSAAGSHTASQSVLGNHWHKQMIWTTCMIWLDKRETV